MATSLSLSLRVLLEDPNNHKEKLSMCNLKPGINQDEQTNRNINILSVIKVFTQ